MLNIENMILLYFSLNFFLAGIYVGAYTDGVEKKIIFLNLVWMSFFAILVFVLVTIYFSIKAVLLKLDNYFLIKVQIYNYLGRYDVLTENQIERIEALIEHTDVEFRKRILTKILEKGKNGKNNL